MSCSTPNHSPSDSATFPEVVSGTPDIQIITDPLGLYGDHDDDFDEDDPRDQEPPQPPTVSKYSFPTAQLFLLEERKAYCVKMLTETDIILAELRGLLAQRQGGRIERSDIPLEHVENYFLKVCFPVSYDLRNEVNKVAKEEGRRRLTRKAVRKLYGVGRGSYVGLKRVIGLMRVSSDIEIEEFELLISTIQNVRADLESFLARTGGDSNEVAKKVLEAYNVIQDSNWHHDFFDEVEKGLYVEIISDIRERFGIGLSQIHVDDVGCGPGRCAQQLCDALKRKSDGLGSKTGDDIRYVRALLRNYTAIEIDGKKAEDAIKLLTELTQEKGKDDFDPYNIETANFFDKDVHSEVGDPRINEGTVHFALSMMRTLPYCKTEDELAAFLANLAKNLQAGTYRRAGGMMLVDTMSINEQLFNPTDEQMADMLDLSHFYTQMIQKYRRDFRQKYADLLPEDVKLEMMPRFTESDNTTGQGFYTREATTVELIRHVIKSRKLNLTVQSVGTSTGKFFEKPDLTLEEQDRLIKLGREWIEKNELEAYYREVIGLRIKQETLSSRLREKIAGQNVEDATEILLDDIAFQMTTKFENDYLILERPKKSRVVKMGQSDPIEINPLALMV